ncbi:hypothetical protein EVAR_5428_1 [Eumeta japonica]|uniref:Uncharacterized protein n=1 Tax=Eumeta variegata TaxID=151549 RepID=A0A4C1T8J8_EUMVA|nr:hypothetical protein EVAR_5428_1 [Eumeta japonica]
MWSVEAGGAVDFRSAGPEGMQGAVGAAICTEMRNALTTRRASKFQTGLKKLLSFTIASVDGAPTVTTCPTRLSLYDKFFWTIHTIGRKVFTSKQHPPKVLPHSTPVTKSSPGHGDAIREVNLLRQTREDDDRKYL